MCTMNFQMFKLVLEKADQIANICWIIEKAREFQKILTSALLPMLKPLTVRIIMNCGKFLKRWEYQTTLYAGQKATIRTRHEITD